MQYERWVTLSQCFLLLHDIIKMTDLNFNWVNELELLPKFSTQLILVDQREKPQMSGKTKKAELRSLVDS